MRSKITIFLLLLVIPCSGLKISSIEVKGAGVLNKDYVSTISGLKQGEEFSIYALQDAIRAIYKSNRFKDVKANVKEERDGVRIEFVVEENPILEDLQLIGAKKVKKSELEHELGLNKGEYVSEKQIWNSQRKIEELYRKKGFPNVSISPSTFISKDGKLILKFEINEGEKAKIKKIMLNGTNQLKAEKLKKKLGLHEKGFLRRGKFDKEKYISGKERLVEFCKENGFLDAHIDKDSIWSVGGDIFISIDIYEGPKYFVKTVEIEGNEIISSERIKKLLGLDTGDVLDMKRYTNGIGSIYAEYGDSGHIHASVKDDIIEEEYFANDSTKRYASVKLEIVEGKPAYVHLIEIKGNKKTFEKVIRRELALKPGEIFRRNKLMRSLRNLYYLNYFEEITPDWNVLENGDVDIVIRVTEKAVGTIQGGVGYNAVDHLVGTFSVKIPNFLGRGWDTSLDLQFGSRKVDISTSFTEPYLFDTPTIFGFELYSTRWKWENYYTEEKKGAGLRIGRKLTWPDDYFSTSIAYHFEALRYYDFSPSYNPNPAYDLRKRTYPIYRSALSYGLTRDSRDNQFYATSGNLNSLNIELAGGPLLGNDQYQKAILRSWWFFPVFKYLSIVAKGKYGVLVNIWEKTKEVPFSERFFAGGISSDGQIRGYPDRSISPSIWTQTEGDTTGKKYQFYLGGRAVMVLSAELRIPAVKDQLYFSIFADAGDVWLTPKETTLRYLKKSVGIGTRFVIPMVGILGFDLGYGFNRPDGAQLEFHFQLGAEQ